MKKKKYLNILLCVLLVILIPFTVFAVTTMKSTDSAQGVFERNTIDRIDLSVTNTDFTLKKKSSGNYVISFILKIGKTEADFYGEVNSVELNGIDYDSMIFTPLNENCKSRDLNDRVLPVKDGKAVPAEYRVDVSFPTEKTKLSPKLSLIYTSGMTQLTAEKHLLEIPLSIEIK